LTVRYDEIMRRPIAREVGVGVGHHEEPRRDGLVLADLVAALRHVVGAQPVEDRAVGLATGEAQHARAQRPEQDGRALHHRSRELEAVDLEGLVDLVDLLAVEGPLHEVEHVARARVGLLVGDRRSSAPRPGRSRRRAPW
jgi:hypothetical protein